MILCLSVCYSCILILYCVYDLNNNNNNNALCLMITDLDAYFSSVLRTYVCRRCVGTCTETVTLVTKIH